MSIGSDGVAYLLEKELAARWRITQSTLQRWRYRGMGPNFVKLSGRVLYPASVVETYERQHLSLIHISEPTRPY